MHQSTAAILILLPIMVCLTAQAAVYRCERNGGVVYTDQPCVGGSAPHRLPPVGVMPGTGPDAADVAKQYDERTAGEREARDKDNAAWNQQHEARAQAQEKFDLAIADKRVIKGMSADHVRRARGSPDEVERRPGGESWVYGSGKSRETVDFVDGRVVRAGKAARR